MEQVVLLLLLDIWSKRLQVKPLKMLKSCTANRKSTEVVAVVVVVCLYFSAAQMSLALYTPGGASALLATAVVASRWNSCWCWGH